MNPDNNYNPNQPQIISPQDPSGAPAPQAPMIPNLQEQPVSPGMHSGGGGSGIGGKLFAVLAVLVILGAGVGAYAKYGHKSVTKTADSGATQSQEALDANAPVSNAIVSISKDGLMPATVDVKAGASIAFVNNDSANHLVSSNDFAASSLDGGQSANHVYAQPGSYTYSVNGLTGTVNVE